MAKVLRGVWLQKMQTKKGFILIYTILVGIVCLTIMMYIFDARLSEVRYSTSNKKYVLKENNYQRDKEHLMTLFFAYINTDTNKGEIIKGINKFFSKSPSCIVEYVGSKVTYIDEKNGFDFTTLYVTPYKRHDYYILEYIDEKFKLIYKRTVYSLN